MDTDIIGKLYDWTLFTCKNLFGLFSGKVEICWIWKIKASYILSSSAKSYWGYTIILLQNRIRVYDLIEHISRYFKICPSKFILMFFISSGGYNFKINYLKYQIRHGMWVHILLNNFASSPLNTSITFGTGVQNAMKNP